MLQPARKLWRRRGRATRRAPAALVGRLARRGGQLRARGARGSHPRRASGSTTCRGSRSRRATSTTSGPATWSRCRRSSSTTGSTSCRSRRSRPSPPQMADEGPAGVPSPHEALAMGQIYERLGRLDDADACFSRASGMGDVPWDVRRHRPRAAGRRAAPSRDPAAPAAALRGRRRRVAGAARERRGGPAYRAGGAAARSRSTTSTAPTTSSSARRFAEHALASERDQAEADALRHRLARLDRKLGRR